MSVREKPIIFSLPMVRAILEGRKSMTRRALNPQPEFLQVYDYKGKRIHDSSHRSWCWKGVAHGRYPDEYIPSLIAMCPYGIPGDQLWVKETHYRWGKWIKNGLTKTGRQRWRFRVSGTAPGLRGVCYLDDNLTLARKRTELGWHKRPSIFMPRIASRILLEITNVRVERLQEIHHKADQFEAEGIVLPASELYQDINRSDKLERHFIKLWESINGPGSWDANPFVWCVSFRRII